MGRKTPRRRSAASRRPKRVPDDTTPKPQHLDRPSQSSDKKAFPIVGIGASAGGLEAFTQLLRALPADTGMAFAFVQHLDPTHPSLLTEILSRATVMPVSEVTDQITAEPNH